MASSEGNPKRVITPLEYAPFERKVELICQACRKKGTYPVGRIFIDPKRAPKPDEPHRPMTEAVGFSGYFHCRHCGAGGPWDFPASTMLLLTALLLEAIATPDRARVHLAQMHLFDGTVIRTATEGEAYLKQRIDAAPTDDFLWSRLGNLYDSAGELDLAFAAYEKAVQLNPGEVESQYTLGCYLMARQQPRQAADHFTQVLCHCRTARRCPPELLQDMARDALERLWQLHNEWNGAIAFPPATVPPTGGGDKGSRPLAPPRVDLSTATGWEDLVAFYLTGRRPAPANPHPPARFAPNPNRPSPIRNEPHAGRNDRCPCGSGKKFKHCCGQGR